MAEPEFLDEAPASDEVQPYDERHLVDYLHLLDAEAANGGWEEAARLIFGIDPKDRPDHARRMYDSHLERARWMTRAGYRQLAARGKEKPALR